MYSSDIAVSRKALNTPLSKRGNRRDNGEKMTVCINPGEAMEASLKTFLSERFGSPAPLSKREKVLSEIICKHLTEKKTPSRRELQAYLSEWVTTKDPESPSVREMSFVKSLQVIASGTSPVFKGMEESFRRWEAQTGDGGEEYEKALRKEKDLISQILNLREQKKAIDNKIVSLQKQRKILFKEETRLFSLLTHPSPNSKTLEPEPAKNPPEKEPEKPLSEKPGSPKFSRYFRSQKIESRRSYQISFHIIKGEKTYCGRSLGGDMKECPPPENLGHLCAVCSRKSPIKIVGQKLEETNPQTTQELLCCFPYWEKKKKVKGKKKIYHLVDLKEKGQTLCSQKIKPQLELIKQLPEDGTRCLVCLKRQRDDRFNAEIVSALR